MTRCQPQGHHHGPDRDELVEILKVARSAALRAGAPYEMADDAAQIVAERMARAWRTDHVRRAHGAGDRAWHAYVRRAGVNAVKDLRRSESRRRIREETAIRGWMGDPLPDRPGARHQTIEQSCRITQYLARLDVIDTVEEHLTGRQRQVMLLTLVEGLTPNEVAERLGITPRVARDHRLKAIAKLRRILRPQAESPPEGLPEAGD
ncbi:MAG: sigma-70 family RNA polymerase sigma factor [Actinomycetota bacterium]